MHDLFQKMSIGEEPWIEVHGMRQGPGLTEATTSWLQTQVEKICRLNHDFTPRPGLQCLKTARIEEGDLGPEPGI